MSTRACLESEWQARISGCSVCGESCWRAAWFGCNDIAVCPVCALDVLPALLADAIWRRHIRSDEVKACWLQASAAFWRAVALCEMREGRSPHRYPIAGGPELP
jgi:hypothetical protein